MPFSRGAFESQAVRQIVFLRGGVAELAGQRHFDPGKELPDRTEHEFLLKFEEIRVETGPFPEVPLDREHEMRMAPGCRS